MMAQKRRVAQSSDGWMWHLHRLRDGRSSHNLKLMSFDSGRGARTDCLRKSDRGETLRGLFGQLHVGFLKIVGRPRCAGICWGEQCQGDPRLHLAHSTLPKQISQVTGFVDAKNEEDLVTAVDPNVLTRTKCLFGNGRIFRALMSAKGQS